MKKAERIIRYFDMFAGVGGFRAGLDLAGGFQCIGHCEIDKYADTSYRAIHAPGKEEVYYFALFALHFGVYTEFGTDPSFFANAPAGAQSNAMIYSLIETTKENCLAPYRYLVWLLNNARTDRVWPESFLPVNVP